MHGETEQAASARPALSPGQARCLAVIKEYVAEHGYAPAMKDIREALDIASDNGVRDFLDRLEEKGYIRRGPNRVARSIVVIEEVAA